VVVGSALGEDVPHRDEELACDRDNGDALRLVAAEPGELAFPVRMGVDCAPSCLDEHAAQVTPPLLGDVPVVLGLAGSADASSQPGVAHQLLGGGKASDVTDGGQDSHGRKQRDAGELNEVGDVLPPGGGHTEAAQLGLHLGELLLQMVQSSDIVLGTQSLGGRDIQRGPPVAIVRGKEIAFGRGEVVTVEDAVQAILGGGLLLDQGVTDATARRAVRVQAVAEPRPQGSGWPPAAWPV